MTPWEALQWVCVVGLAWLFLAVALATTLSMIRGNSDRRIDRFAKREGISRSTAESILRNKGRIK